MKFSALCLLALAVPAHGIQMFGTVEELLAEYGGEVVLTGEICCDSADELCDGYIPDGTPAPLPAPTTPAPEPVPTTPAPVPVPTTPAPVPVPTTPAPVPVPTTTAPVPVPTTPAPVPVPTTPAPVPGVTGSSGGSTSSPTMTPGTAAPTMGPCIEMTDVVFDTRGSDICAGWTEEFVDGVQMTDDCSDGSGDYPKGLVIDQDTDEWHASFSTGGPAMDTVKVWYSFCLTNMANDGHEFNLHVTDNKGQTYHIDTVIFGDYGEGCHNAEAFGVFPQQTDTVDVAFKDHTLGGSVAVITVIKVHYCEGAPTPAPVLSAPTPQNTELCPTPPEPTSLEVFSGHVNQDALGFQHMECQEGFRCVGFEDRKLDSAAGGYHCGGTMLSNAFANPQGETGGKDFVAGDRVYCALGGDVSKIVCVTVDEVESKSGGEQTGFKMRVGCSESGLAFDNAEGTCDTSNVIDDVGFSFVFIKGGSPCGKGKDANCPSGTNDPFLDGVNCSEDKKGNKNCNVQDGQVYYAPDGDGFDTFENTGGMTFYTSCANGQISQDPDCEGGGRFGLSHMEICFAEYCPE